MDAELGRMPMSHSRGLNRLAKLTGVTAVLAAAALIVAPVASAVASYTPIESFGTGLLGNGTTGSSAAPGKIAGLAGHVITAISSYSEYGQPADHTLALTLDGSIYSWGRNDHGQLGNGTDDDSFAPSYPLPLSGISGHVVAVAAGYQFSLALTSTGQVLTWGASGELGDGSVTDRYEPAPIPAPGGQWVVAIAAGESHAQVVTASGQVWGWGSNTDGELGDGTFADSLLPVRAELPAGFVATTVAAGGVHYAAEPEPQSHTLVLGADGRVFAWGANEFGQLGTKTTTADQPLPVQTAIPGHATVVSIAAGGENSGAVTATGGVLTWGLNTYGALGNGNAWHNAHPTLVALPAGTVVTGLSMSYYTTLVMTSTNQVFGSGDNATFAKGALGTSTVTHSYLPILVAMPVGTVVAIDAGGPTSYVILHRT